MQMHGLRQINRLNDIARVTKKYTINGSKYNVICNFITDVIHCEKRNGATVFDTTLGEYTNFEGNLEAFIAHKVSPVRLGGV